VAWYPLSLRTDSVNRGISISFLMLAIVVLLVSFGVSLFFFIPEYCHVISTKSGLNSSGDAQMRFAVTEEWSL
jgi:hypothetical protein